MNAMKNRRLIVLGVLVVCIGGACILGACGSTEPPGLGIDPPDPPGESPLAIKGTLPPEDRRQLGSSLAPPNEPMQCSEIIRTTPCKLYSIKLMGDFANNPVTQKKYKNAFGSSCYDFAMGGFGCLYKKEDVKPYGKACKDAKMVAEVFGAAPYDDYPMTCKPVPGTNEAQYTLQIGPDPANVTYIDLVDAPLETSLIDVGGVPTAINGPYRNLPEPPKVKVGGVFDCASGQVGADGRVMSQRKWILEVNRKTHGGKIRSDLAGFTWPCDEPGKPICTEETELVEESPNDPNAAQVHHSVRRKDLRGCFWGTNSNSNAVVISRKLNRFLWNKYPEANEVNWVNQVPAYTP